MANWEDFLFRDKPDWVGPKIVQYLLGNPAILLTATYVLISGLGLLYQYILFDSFGVSVIDYAKPEDLFLAAFKNPSAMFSGAVIGASMVFYRHLAKYAQKRENWLVRSVLLMISWIGLLRREVLIPIGICYFIFMYAHAAELEGNRLINASNNVVGVTSKSDPKKFELLPIGSTGGFLFGVELDDQLKKAKQTERHSSLKPVIRAIPFSEIARLDYESSEFYVGGWRSYLPNSTVERDAPQAALPPAPRPSPSR